LAVVIALEKVGAGGAALRLKWPNDVLRDGRKLAGILVELLPGAPHVAVIGIGLNLRLPADMPADIQAGSAALCNMPEPHQLLAGLLREQLTTMEYFAATGFASLRAAWLQHHAFTDRAVVLHSDFAPPQYGICRGVAADGALLLESDGRIERILSGEVSLRSAS
jgi:BirA family biotin operon repressor/biotin-[acetyl-CoA-carboxylase] ligase